jgi:hypothetical protein
MTLSLQATRPGPECMAQLASRSDEAATEDSAGSADAQDALGKIDKCNSSGRDVQAVASTGRSGTVICYSCSVDAR